MQLTKITKITEETRHIRTIRVEKEVSAIPGQFVMVWIPGIDEKPMSLSYTTSRMGITVLVKGPFTKRLAEMREGDLLGIRGPYGRGFKISGDKLLLVGGGVGVAPIAPLAEKAAEQDKDVTAVIGATTAEDLLFVDRIKRTGAEVYISTDDGSAGTKGFTTDVTSNLLKEKSFDQCFACGPEIMMVKLLNQMKKKKIPTQLSLERYFKCGIGICGHCALDYSGLRVCRDGPVFTDIELENVSEIGKYWRGPSGTKLFFNKEVA
jgi:dihydroorotate dehydrogenase electron transfer subunit